MLLWCVHQVVSIASGGEGRERDRRQRGDHYGRSVRNYHMDVKLTRPEEAEFSQVSYL